MRIRMTTPITDFNDQPLKAADGEGELTIRDVIQGAILASTPSDAQSGWQEKAKLHQLGVKAGSGESVDFSANEIVTIKMRMGEVMRPLIVGRAVEILDPAQPEE